MTTERACPKCGKPMEYHDADPDVGILTEAWVCDCGHVEIPDLGDGSDELIPATDGEVF